VINIVLAFITGLTTGGLSCLAVQGGLLASSLAGQIEADVQVSAPGRKKKQSANTRREARARLAQPILIFLAAKLLAYTLLGFALGWVGQIFQLTPAARAALQIGIGIFMLGSALRMLNVHPIFRYFAFEPPAFLRRKIRRAASSATQQSSLAVPGMLGLLTVLIPCGVTQVMMAAAMSTASPTSAAALMFAFTLGTSPVFFAVAFFAFQLGKRLEKNFTRFVAVVLLVLAIITVDGGLALAGSPVTLSRFARNILPGSAAEANVAETVTDGSIITVNVVNNGYRPSEIHAKAGVPVTLRLVTKDVRSCALAIVIPALGVQKVLEPTGESRIAIPAQEAGTRMPFTCTMGMYGATIIFDL